MHFAFNRLGSCFHFLPIRLNRRQNQDRICLTSTIFTKFSYAKRLQGICLAASRGRGARTPIYGFGDRCSTIELFPYGNPLFTRSFIIARQAGSCQLIFLIFYGFLLQLVTVQIGLRVSQGTPSVHRADRKKTQRSRAYGPLHSVSVGP